ncbi:hypothetical protein Pfo_031519 [Paulownia fortunei]|nr:hypothetical protein Pfo_031519 [Paulownia fortunei]
MTIFIQQVINGLMLGSGYALLALGYTMVYALAAAGVVLIGLYYNSIDPLMGMTPGLKAFVAAVLGGIGIIPGASVGGWLIGILETMQWLPWALFDFHGTNGWLNRTLWRHNDCVDRHQCDCGIGLEFGWGYRGNFARPRRIYGDWAYATALIMGVLPGVMGFVLGMVTGIAVSGIVALIVGIPTLRLRGDYLAIATLGFAEIIRIVINELKNY